MKMTVLMNMTLYGQQVVVFLLAHQDDEFGVYFAIEQWLRRGATVLCLYLTDGGFAGQQSDRRNAESRYVLRQLGVHEEDIHFVGVQRGFRDGKLYTCLDDALAAIEALLDPIPLIRALYIHAWEGGHQDHDAVHLIGAAYAGKAGLLEQSRQFTLYRASPSGLKLFAPLQENGPVVAEPIPWEARRRFMRLSLSYRSQWKSWSVLLPYWFILIAPMEANKHNNCVSHGCRCGPTPGPFGMKSVDRRLTSSFMKQPSRSYVRGSQDSG